MCYSERGASMKLLGDELFYLWGNLTQTLALKGTWLPKLVPFTDQANINMAGNGAVFLWSQSLETLFPLGKMYSL